jgi:hypothetical protein
MPVRISLSSEQLAAANAEAVRRQTENEAKGLRGRNRAPAVGEKALAMHRLGCIGEMAVATYMGLQDYVYGDKVPIKNSADLPGELEVKTRAKHGYDLLIQIDGDPNKIYVLVTHEGRDTELVGWIRGKDAMRKEWIKEYVRGRPCYAVKQSSLKDIESLLPQLDIQLPKVLSSHEAWLTAVEDNGDLFLNFDSGLMKQLGWEVGDILTWDVDPSTQSCVIRKATDERTEEPPKSLPVRVAGDG